MKNLKNKSFSELVSLLGTPAALLVLGCLLLFRPDSASALISTLLGWVLTLIGAVLAIRAGKAPQHDRLNKLLAALVVLCCGIWLLKNPLAIAAALGRICGILLMIRGILDLQKSKAFHSGRGFAVATAAAGLVLFFIPMTASRLIFSLCGAVVLVLGIVILLDRLSVRRLKEPDSSNIVDAL